MPLSLVATRLHRVEGMCKLETRTHMGNSHPHGKLAPTWENLYPPLLWRRDCIVSKACAS